MRKDKILIIGGNSFLGFHLSNYLSTTFHITSTYLTRRPTQGPFVRCNLLSKPELFGLGHFDCVIQYSSIISGASKLDKNLQMVANAVEYSNKIQSRFVFVSSSQVNFSLDPTYRQSQIQSEQLIKSTSNDYIIIRPAAPYGARLDYAFTRTQAFHVLAKFVSNSPFVPVIGSGSYLRQPVHVDNLNRLIEYSITSDLTKKIFEIGGPRQIAFNEIIDIISKSKSRTTMKVHLPEFVFQLGSRLTSFIDSELVSAVKSDEKADNKSWQEHFHIDLIPFEQGVLDL